MTTSFLALPSRSPSVFIVIALFLLFTSQQVSAQPLTGEELFKDSYNQDSFENQPTSNSNEYGSLSEQRKQELNAQMNDLGVERQVPNSQAKSSLNKKNVSPYLNPFLLNIATAAAFFAITYFGVRWFESALIYLLQGPKKNDSG